MHQRFEEKEKVKVLVCGGRDFVDYGSLQAVLDQIDTAKEIICIIHGCATGADALADKWALENKKLRMLFPPEPEQNTKMLHKSVPDILVAFPGGPDVQDMISKAKEFNEKYAKQIMILQFTSPKE